MAHIFVITGCMQLATIGIIISSITVYSLMVMPYNCLLVHKQGPHAALRVPPAFASAVFDLFKLCFSELELAKTRTCHYAPWLCCAFSFSSTKSKTNESVEKRSAPKAGRTGSPSPIVKACFFVSNCSFNTFLLFQSHCRLHVRRVSCRATCQYI